MDPEINRIQGDVSSEPYLLNPSFAMIFTDLYHCNITNLVEFQKSLDFYEISQEAGLSFLQDLASKGLLQIDEGHISIDRSKEWTKLGSNPRQGIHFVPELFQIVSKRGLENKANSKSEDKFLNFAAYFDFPGDETTLRKLRSAYTNFYQELHQIHEGAKEGHKDSDEIYTVCVGSCRLEREDFQ